MQDLAAKTAGHRAACLRVGFDLVQVSGIARSLERFGARFEDRLFTPDEVAYARSGAGMTAERLAARFAAKEAVIKALRLGSAGVGWRDIEVRKLDDGDCSVRLHGRAAAIASERGVRDIVLSLSHDGDYAGAVVTILLNDPERDTPRL